MKQGGVAKRKDHLAFLAGWGTCRFCPTPNARVQDVLCALGNARPWMIARSEAASREETRPVQVFLGSSKPVPTEQKLSALWREIVIHRCQRL